MACTAGEQCVDGQCTNVCPEPMIECGGDCIDPAHDPDFCGATADCVGGNAGTECRDDQACMDGACACVGAVEECNGACMDLSDNEANCGGCGIACAGNEQCLAGVCTGPALSTLFWANFGDSLWRAEADGSGAVALMPALGGVTSVAVDPVTSGLFYEHSGPLAIARADLDGTNAGDVVALGSNLGGLAVDPTNGTLYWSEFAGSRIMRANFDGTNEQVVADMVGNPSGLAVDATNSRVFFITYNSTAMHRVNFDGSGLTTIAPGLGGQGVGVAFDDSTQQVYYSLRGDAVHRMDADGSNQIELVSGQIVVQGIAIDTADGRIYWAAPFAGMIRRANLADGTNVEDVVSSNGNTWHMTVLPNG